MLVVTFPDGVNCIRATGRLTQWDYGQKIEICGLDLNGNTEVHWSLSGDDKTIINIGRWENGSLIADVPDVLLEDGRDIRGYIYYTNMHEGRTIYTVIIDVGRRARPEKVDIPENQDILGYLLNNKADNMELLEGAIQLMSNGNPVGDKIRLSDIKGREVELKNDGVAICWRYTDSNEWKILICLDDLKGEPGETPEFEIREGHLYAIYKEE